MNTLKKVKTATARAINDQEVMSESLEMRLERGVHMSYNGDKLYYPGEKSIDESQSNYE